MEGKVVHHGRQLRHWPGNRETVQRQGARVVITGRDQQTLDEAKRVIGGDVAVPSDTSKLTEIDKLLAEVQEKFGKILFVNAGVAKFAPVEAVTEEFFDSVTDIIFKGAYFTIHKTLALLSYNAAIRLKASVAANIGMPDASVYAASKAALITLARNLSAELVGRGIRVTVVSPARSRRRSSGAWDCRPKLSKRQRRVLRRSCR